MERIEPVKVVKGYDLDGVLFNFIQGFIDRAKEMGLSQHFPATFDDWVTWHPGDPDIFSKIWNEIAEDENFWIDLKPFEDAKPEIVEADIYITARPVPSWVSAYALHINEFPDAPVVTVPPGSSKVDVIRRYDVGVFIEDKHSAFMEINEKSAAVCFLLTRPSNQNEDDGPWSHLRLRSLLDYQNEKIFVV